MLQVGSFGPFNQGVVERAAFSLLPDGVVRRARNGVLSGVGALVARAGSTRVTTLLDDQATPQPCTRVCAVVPFADGALLVAHSTTTEKVYLYTADATLGSVTRVGVLWTSVPVAPVVWIAEGLGVAYLAHGEAASALALAFPLRTWNGTTLATPTYNLDGTGAVAMYPSGCVAYHGHCVTWGYDSGTVAATAYTPERLRMSGPNFDPFDAPGATSDSFSVGHRVRSVRERVWAACVAGEVCYLGMPFGLWALTGYGRDSWQAVPLDETLGVIAPQSMVAAGAACYYWSARGPMRVSGLSAPEPLWDAIPDLLARVVNPQQIVACYDEAVDQVQFHVSLGGGTRARVAFDVRRQAWLGPDSDVGLAVGCAGTVQPVFSPSVAADGPAGPPTGFTGTIRSQADGIVNIDWAWTAGETHPDAVTILEVTVPGVGVLTFTFPASDPPGANGSFVADGVTITARLAHRRNGQLSTWATTSVVVPLTTASGGGSGSALLAPTRVVVRQATVSDPGHWLSVTVTLSGDPTVWTEIELAGPFASSAPPVDTDFAPLVTLSPGVATTGVLSVAADGFYTARARHTSPSLGTTSPWVVSAPRAIV